MVSKHTWVQKYVVSKHTWFSYLISVGILDGSFWLLAAVVVPEWVRRVGDLNFDHGQLN